MRSIMKEGIIKGPFLVLLFLIIICGTNWRHQCEAASVIADSGNVSNEPNNITNNPIAIPSENKTTTLVLPVTHSSVVQLQPDKMLKNIVEEDKISIAQRSVPSQPCPIENHSMRKEMGDKQKQENNNNVGGSNLENGNYRNDLNSTQLKEEKVETAIEKISESISGVFSTIKNSVASIFSPGTGIPDLGRMDCHNESINSNAGGETKNMSLDSDDHQHHQPTLKEETQGLLIHPVSSNDTSHNTNETNTSMTTIATTTLRSEHLANTTDASSSG